MKLLVTKRHLVVAVFVIYIVTLTLALSELLPKQKSYYDIKHDWEALGSLEPGLYVMATPRAPDEMEGSMSNFITNQATSNDFISIIVSGERLLKRIEIRKAYLVESEKCIRLNVIFYVPPPPHVAASAAATSGKTARIPNPTDKTAIIFVGKLPQGEYTILAHIRIRSFYYLGEMESYGDWNPPRTSTLELTLKIS